MVSLVHSANDLLFLRTRALLCLVRYLVARKAQRLTANEAHSSLLLPLMPFDGLRAMTTSQEVILLKLSAGRTIVVEKVSGAIED